MELRALAARIGAPGALLQRGTYVHLDVRGETRRRALADPEVHVFEDTRGLLRHLRRGGAARTRRRSARE